MASDTEVASAEPAQRPPRLRAWLRKFFGRPDGQGLIRAAIAVYLIGTLVVMHFVATAEGEEELASATRTLVVVVVAFFFGQRTAARRQRQDEESRLRNERSGAESERSATTSQPTGDDVF